MGVHRRSSVVFKERVNHSFALCGMGREQLSFRCFMVQCTHPQCCVSQRRMHVRDFTPSFTHPPTRAACRDLTGLVGKEEISSLVGTQHSPLLRRLLDYSDQQQRKEWDSPHDENGRRRMTATEYARKVLP